MSTEPQPEGAETRVPDQGDQQQGAWPSDQPDAAIDMSPGDRRAAAPWTQATDASGALRATREMPEPDSLGG